MASVRSFACPVSELEGIFVPLRYQESDDNFAERRSLEHLSKEVATSLLLKRRLFISDPKTRARSRDLRQPPVVSDIMGVEQDYAHSDLMFVQGKV